MFVVLVVVCTVTSTPCLQHCLQGYQSICRIAKMSNLVIPQEILDILEPIQENDEAVRKYGIDHAVAMCRELFDSDIVYGLHMYTLNREVATIEILKQLGLWSVDPCRPLPWKTTANHNRSKEDVRPIFWNLRPTSYVYRTLEWNDFPNGRWGRSSSASFGDVKDYYLFYLQSSAPREERLAMWGEALESEQDVWRVFEKYITGEPQENGVKVRVICVNTMLDMLQYNISVTVTCTMML